MRTMDYLLAIALLFTVGSCSKETAMEYENLAAVEYRSRLHIEEQRESQEIIERDLHRYYVLKKLAQLDYQKKELEQKIDDGRKNLVPRLEVTMKDFSRYEKQLVDLSEALCHYLEKKARQLAKQAERGDEGAKKELSEMDEALKQCGVEVSYREWIANGYNFASLPKTTTVGGCSNPSPDFSEACDIPLKSGKKIIKADESVRFMELTTTEGKKIARAELLGKGENGLYEYSLDLPSSDSKLFLSVSKGDVEYRVPIKISDRL